MVDKREVATNILVNGGAIFMGNFMIGFGNMFDEFAGGVTQAFAGAVGGEEAKKKTEGFDDFFFEKIKESVETEILPKVAEIKSNLVGFPQYEEYMNDEKRVDALIKNASNFSSDLPDLRGELGVEELSTWIQKLTKEPESEDAIKFKPIAEEVQKLNPEEK
ncbi:MAG: hypothetical protein ACI83O_000844 [Patescibacteria group bacterium]|jgi:hypothetical protein